MKKRSFAIEIEDKFQDAEGCYVARFPRTSLGIFTATNLLDVLTEARDALLRHLGNTSLLTFKGFGARVGEPATLILTGKFIEQ
jgi:hypothetical protein